MQSYRCKYPALLMLLTLMICSGCGTPLIRAVQKNDIKKVKSLLDEGADVNGKGYAIQKTALYDACISGYMPIVKLLLERSADVNAMTTTKRTPLSAAAYYDHKEVFFVLLEAGARPIITDKRPEGVARTYLFAGEFYENKGNKKLAVEYYKKAEERCQKISQDYTARSLKEKSQARNSSPGSFVKPGRLNLAGELMALDMSKGNPKYYNMYRDAFSRVPQYTQSSSASSTMEKWYAKKSSDWTQKAIKCKEKIAELSSAQ